MVALERPVPRMISVSERPILLAATISRISAYLVRIPRGLFRLSLGNVMFQIVKTVFDLIVYCMRVTSRKDRPYARGTTTPVTHARNHAKEHQDISSAADDLSN